MHRSRVSTNIDSKSYFFCLLKSRVALQSKNILLMNKIGAKTDVGVSIWYTTIMLFILMNNNIVPCYCMMAIVIAKQTRLKFNAVSNIYFSL